MFTADRLYAYNNDELSIVPGLRVRPIPPLGAPLSSILFDDISAIEVL